MLSEAVIIPDGFCSSVEMLVVLFTLFTLSIILVLLHTISSVKTFRSYLISLLHSPLVSKIERWGEKEGGMARSVQDLVSI